MEFKSPVSKVVKFLRDGRSNWKAKCVQTKREKKLLANQARAVQKSRDYWKQIAKTAQRQIRQLEQEVERLKCDAPRAEQPTPTEDRQPLVVGRIPAPADCPSHISRRGGSPVHAIGDGCRVQPARSQRGHARVGRIVS